MTISLKSKDENFFRLQNYYPQGLAGGYIPNFAVDLNKTQDYKDNQRKRNFKTLRRRLHHCAKVCRTIHGSIEK